jgi:preprotein translocase subunit YajC
MEGFGSLGIFLLMFIGLWALMVLPQRKLAKQREEMLNSLKSGDEVETVGHIFGTIDSVNDDKIVLKVGVNDSTKIMIHKQGVERRVDKDVAEDKEKK